MRRKKMNNEKEEINKERLKMFEQIFDQGISYETLKEKYFVLRLKYEKIKKKLCENDRISMEIEEHVYHAIQKHPEFPENIVEMVAIMAEEAGEAIRAANNYQHESGTIEELKEELYQTAAMCIRCLHNLP